jgi:CRP-like cAMP-binding protein
LKPDSAKLALKNRVLAALPNAVLQRLLPDLHAEEGEFKQMLAMRNAPIENIYFFASGVGSTLSRTEGGGIVEVATIGREGFSGLPVFLGPGTSPMETLLQIPGSLLRMSSNDFRMHASEEQALSKVIHAYTQALLTQISQNAACNRMHTVDERCARWLLMTRDRVDSDEFPLTQEFLAQMLGVRRASVSTSASAYQDAGTIRYTRGSITIIDRAALEHAACECYGIIKDEYDRVLGRASSA